MVIISSNAGHLTGVKNVSGTITLSCIMTRPPLYLIHPHILTHQSLQNAAVKLKCSPLLMTCKVLVRSPSNVMIEAHVLLNNESSTSFITEHLVQTLRLPRAHQNVHILGIAGSSPQNSPHSVAKFCPSSIHDPSNATDVSTAVVPTVTCDLPACPVSLNHNWSRISNIPLADPTFGQPGRINILMFSCKYCGMAGGLVPTELL